MRLSLEFHGISMVGSGGLLILLLELETLNMKYQL